MAKLIDRDKLIAAIVNNAVSPSNISDDEKDNFIENHFISYLNGKAQRQNEIIDIIEAQLKADTEQHAHWIYNKEWSEGHIEKIYNCSNCQYEAWGEDEKTNYCPYCGAKMDEDKEVK